MTDYVTLAEAATYLGVSKATLRNWDKAGKLNAIRHPTNDYRLYPLGELRSLKSQMSLFEDSSETAKNQPLTAREVRRLVARLHNIVRDSDSGSSLLDRFDELSKLLFLGMMAARDEQTAKALQDTAAGGADYAAALRDEYQRLIEQVDIEAPPAFRVLRCSDRAVTECGRALAAVNFATSDIDVKGLAYEEIIKRTFDKTENQQFFTPTAIVQFLVNIVGPLTGQICDPAAGTGGFLVEVARRTTEYGSLTALEIDQRLAWTAGLNTLLHGGHSVHALCLPDGGSLGPAGEQYFEAFDLIITNPPFGSDYSDPEALASYDLGKDRVGRRRGILFIERCWRMLRERGKLAIIIDEGVLNLPHARDVREFILSHFKVRAIISLPETAFMPYASVNSAILFLEKGAHQATDTVFFGKAEKIGRRSNGDEDVVYFADGSTELNSDLPHLLASWKAGPEQGVAPDELTYWSSLSFLGDHGDLRLDFRYHHPSRDEATARLRQTKWPLVTVSDVTQEINETLIPAKELPDSVILYTGLAHIEAGTGRAVQEPTPTNSLKSAVKRYERGDILFAKMRPNLRKVALMAFEEGGYASPECMVLRPISDAEGKPALDPTALAALLRSDLIFGQITHLIAGIGRPRLNGSSLRRARLPLPPKELQEEARVAFEAELNAVAALREKAAKMLNDAAAREKISVEHIAARFGESLS
jgi:tRNA1(Val) A37 N6-methylase TrmN6